MLRSKNRISSSCADELRAAICGRVALPGHEFYDEVSRLAGVQARAFFTVGEYDDHVIWGRVVRIHIRDDLYLGNGRVDTAAIAPVGRLAAEYSLVDNVFTTPLDAEVLKSREGRRMERLDGLPTNFSAVDQKSWLPSGSVIAE